MRTPLHGLPLQSCTGTAWSSRKVNLASSAFSATTPSCPASLWISDSRRTLCSKKPKQHPVGGGGFPGLVLRRASQDLCVLASPSTVAYVTPRGCWRLRSTEAEIWKRALLQDSYRPSLSPFPGRCFLAASMWRGPPPSSQGSTACHSCNRCSWACWPAIVLWEPGAPAAREYLG